jgi:hypothetical protein
MSVFGFIENFFFISLALVFGLVILLVYHFKSRITVAEKKSESMYGLLTAVVKEIKTLRGMFGLGGGKDVVPPANIQPSEQVSVGKEEIYNGSTEDEHSHLNSNANKIHIDMTKNESDELI